MKEITRIHLAKTPFSIEVDAKELLAKYVAEIEQQMDAEAEAMREIESRMVELLGERGVGKDGVISADDVVALQQQMGEPQEFSDGEDRPTTDKKDEEKSQKRLMRDTDRAIFGGVCGGIAAYFGVSPLWVRLLAIILPFVSFGTAILVYIILWIVVPPARTAAEKLQMRGQAVTLDSLKRLSLDENIKMRTISVGLRILQILATIAALAVAFGSLIALIVGGVMGFSFVSMLGDFATQKWLWGVLISLIIGGAALVGLSSLAAVSAIRWRIKKSIGLAMIIMLAIGAFSISSVALFGVQSAQELVRDEERLSKTVKIELPENLEGIKSIAAETGNFSLEYSATEPKMRAELKYLALKGMDVPKISVERQGDQLMVKADNYQKKCPRLSIGPDSSCLLPSARVIFYGPSNDIEIVGNFSLRIDDSQKDN